MRVARRSPGPARRGIRLSVSILCGLVVAGSSDGWVVVESHSSRTTDSNRKSAPPQSISEVELGPTTKHEDV